MAKIRLNELTYNVEICGTGEPLLLLHGFTGDGTTWSEVADQLKNDYQCIMPDLVGHGQTDAPADGELYKMANVVEQLRQLLDYFKIEQTHLLGYSMGGRLAIAFAIKYPDRVNKLIIESASPGLSLEQDRKKRRYNDAKLADFIINEGIAAFVDFWEEIPLFATQKDLPDTIKTKIRNQRLNNCEQGLANSLLYMGTGSQRSYWDELAQLTMDVLYIAGSLDEKFCIIAREMSQLTPCSKKVIVNNCGHTIHVEDCAKFGTIVSKFLL